MERVVITGLGCITPVGLSVGEFWHELTSGVSGIGPITRFDASDLPVQIGAEVKGFDPREYMDAKLARRSHRATQFALVAAFQALQDAGLTVDAAKASSVGVVINTGFGGASLMEEGTQRLIASGPRRISPLFVPLIIPNAVTPSPARWPSPSVHRGLCSRPPWPAPAATTLWLKPCTCYNGARPR